MCETEKWLVKCSGLQNVKSNIHNIFLNARNGFDKKLKKLTRHIEKNVIDTIKNICINDLREIWKSLKCLGPRKSHRIPMKV